MFGRARGTDAATFVAQGPKPDRRPAVEQRRGDQSVQFAIVETAHGISRRLGVVVAVTPAGAILQALRKWPPQMRADGTHPMLSTERLTVH
jgi:hypothetical protein